ncbi:putative glycoside hydrolase family 15 protein [Candidatus Bathyarchaeota archaeon]|nr:putative glycoside hydrolase family 15 protein [Candidatus Bathyarchaeota archaeon]
MRKNTILLFVVSAVACLVTTQPLPLVASSSLNASSRQITLTGTIIYPGRIIKYIVAYGFSGGFPNDTADFIANHFDLVDAHYSEQSIYGFRRMKSRNTDLIIIVYRNAMGTDADASGQLEGFNWEVVNQHEDWFVHDKNGNRVRNKFWGWYLMDVGSAGWREFYANWCLRILTETSIDGIFADDVWDSLPCGDFLDSWWNPWTVTNVHIDKAIGDRWYNDMLGFITYVKQRIGNKLLIVNTGDNNGYVDACDGKMDEEFIHPDWYSYSEFHDEYIHWTEKVDRIRTTSVKNRYVMIDAGFSELYGQEPTSEMVNRILMYCFSSYLMALEGSRTSFGFGDYWSSDNSKGYYSIFDQAKALGSPIDEYHVYQSIYARDFANGKVLVNPSNSSYYVLLDQDYRTLNGDIISNITLDNHTGTILFGE